MGYTKRLTTEQALKYGFEVKEKKGNNNPKYYINNEIIKKFDLSGSTVNNKTTSKSKSNNYKTKPKFVLSAWNSKGYMMDIDEYCIYYKLPKKDIASYKLVSHTGTPFYNIVFNENKIKKIDYLVLRDKIVLDMQNYSPVYPKIKYKKQKESYCLVFDPADIHIGKIASSFETGEDYNNQIAVKRVLNGLNGILNKSKGFNFDKVIFVAGNDILHVDNPSNTTTSGTRQDVSGMWYDSFLMAKKLLTDVIEILMQIAPVDVVYNPSNHDYMSGFFLLDSISSWFRLSEDVTFNCDMAHRKYTRYYDNLIATTHMDGAKMDLLPNLAAQESKMWDSTTRRYIYGHHVHHKIAKDYIGITLETLRSPSGADSWHHRKGYQHAPVAVEGFIHDKHQGQIARITHNF